MARWVLVLLWLLLAGVLQCVAVCCIVLQCVALLALFVLGLVLSWLLLAGVLQCVAVHCSCSDVYMCIYVCIYLCVCVFACVTMYFHVCCMYVWIINIYVSSHVCCSVLPHVALRIINMYVSLRACCNVLQCVAMCCSVL